MSKQTEDLLYEITMSIAKHGIKDQFYNQMKKMKTQDKHKWKTIAEKYEYAYRKVKDD